MRKVLACALSLVVGLAILQLAGCKKSEPTTGKPGQTGGTAKPEQPGAAATSDPLAAAGKRLVGVWKGKPPMPPELEKAEGKLPPMDMTVTIEFKDGGTAVMEMMGEKANAAWKVVKAEGNTLAANMEIEEPDLGALTGKEKGKDAAKPTKKTEELTIVFQTDDKITMGPTNKPAQTLTLDRQK